MFLPQGSSVQQVKRTIRDPVRRDPITRAPLEFGAKGLKAIGVPQVINGWDFHHP